jgi:1,4-dihydroxy-2-naphthoate octaprenyltransferase
LNNIRDIDSDRIAGKYSFPVRFGHAAALAYHRLLLFGAIALGAIFQIADLIRNSLDFQPLRFTFLVLLPFVILLDRAVRNNKPEELDPWLKKTALTALAFMFLFGLGMILSRSL